jgi:hypothetical protein
LRIAGATHSLNAADVADTEDAPMLGRRFLMVAGLALSITVLAAPVSAASTPFKGVWTSTDNDGSSQMLTVSAGTRPSVVYQDFYASGCDTFGGPATHWVGAGRGEVDGDTLFVGFHKSGCGTFLQGGYGDEYVYDSGSDTLTDAFGIVWYRA